MGSSPLAYIWSHDAGNDFSGSGRGISEGQTVTIRAHVVDVFLMLAALGLGGCANDGGAQALSTAPSYLGADLSVMGGARSAALSSRPESEQRLIIEPTSSSKVLSAIVFERVTGRTAYPDGSAFNK